MAKGLSGEARHMLLCKRNGKDSRVMIHQKERLQNPSRGIVSLFNTKRGQPQAKTTYYHTTFFIIMPASSTSDVNTKGLAGQTDIEKQPTHESIVAAAPATKTLGAGVSLSHL